MIISKQRVAFRLRWPTSWGHVYLLLALALSLCNRIAVPVAGVTVRPEHVLAGLASLALIAFSGRVPRPTLVKGWLPLIVWLALNLIASLAFSPQASASLRTLLLLTAGMVTMILVTYFGRRWGSRLLPVYLDLWFAAILIGVLGAAFDVVLGSEFFSERYTDVVTYLRIRGTFWEPNFFGISAMMLGIILWDQYISSSRQARETRIPLRLVVCILAVILSGTRSSQVVFVIGIIIATLIRAKLTPARLVRLSALALAILIVSGLLLAGIVHTSYTDRLIGTLTDPESSSSLIGRRDMYVLAWNQMPSHFWLGHGTNAFGQVNPLYDGQQEAIYGHQGNYLASLPLALLYDTGIIGMLMFLGWSLAHHYAAFIRSRARDAHPLLWPFALASLLMFVTFFTTNGLLLTFPWVHIGVTTVLTAFSQQDRGLQNKPAEQI